MKLTGRMSKWTSPKDVILKVGEGVEGVGLGGGCWKRGQLWEGGWSGVEWGWRWGWQLWKGGGWQLWDSVGG